MWAAAPGRFWPPSARRIPALQLTLFDLPAVLAGAARRAARGRRHAASRQLPRRSAAAGRRCDQPDPGALRPCRCHGGRAAGARSGRRCPPGGRLIISEPMSGGDAARSGDGCLLCRLHPGDADRAHPVGGRDRRAAGGRRALRTCGSRPAIRPFVTSVVDGPRLTAADLPRRNVSN